MNIQFRKTLLSTCICSAVASLASGLVLAEENTVASQEELLEEISVVGIRASLMSAVDAKKMSDSISDSIIAEEIGKSSDENIAEALSRVSGVSLDRSGNSRQTITVRGIEAALNDVKINGVSLTSNSNSQAVDLSLFSADILSRVDVVKSPSANQEEGSLGAAINLQTVAPLGAKETMVVSVENRYNDLSEENTPRGSFSFVNKLNEKMGISGSFFYDEQSLRKDEFSQFNANARRFNDVIDADTGEVVAGPTWAVQPNFFLNRLSLDDRTKLGGTFTFQYQPTEETDIRFDVSYSDQEIDHVHSFTRMHNLQRGSDSEIIVDRSTGGSNTVVGGSNAKMGSLSQTGQWTNDTEALVLGAQFEHMINDQWTIAGRVGRSATEESYSDALRMNWQGGFSDVGDPDSWCGVRYENGSEGDSLPILDYCQAYDANDPSTLELKQIRSDVREIEDTKNSFYFDVDRSFENSFITSMEFGVKYTDRSKSVQAEEVALNDSAFEGNTPIFASDVSVSSLTGGEFLDGIAPNGAPTDWIHPNLGEAFDLAFPSGIGAGTPNEFTSNPAKSWKVDEKTSGAYVQFNYEFLNGDVTGNFGVRYAKTEIDSRGHTGFIFDKKLPFNTVSSTPVSGSNDYSEILPSANIRWAVAEDVVLRSSLARVMARPSLSDLRPGTEVRARNVNETPTANGGNTNLDPFLADQFDMSAEWYFAEGALLSGAVFFKDFKEFTYQSSTEIQLDNPETGTCIVDRSQLEEADVLTATSPCADISNTQVNNGFGAEVKGIELSYQQVYDFLPGALSHLGLSANYTYADSEIEIDSDNPFNGLPFPNTSKHSSNVTLFWENDTTSFRLVHSYRSAAVTKVADRNSTFIRDDRSVLDFSANYSFTDNLKLSFSANNLTDTYDTILETLTNPVVGGSTQEGIVQEFDGDLDDISNSRVNSIFDYGRNYRLSLRYTF